MTALNGPLPSGDSNMKGCFSSSSGRTLPRMCLGRIGRSVSIRNSALGNSMSNRIVDSSSTTMPLTFSAFSSE